VHEAQVLQFYEFLRANGVDALIDAEVAGRPQYWPDWMSAQIRQGGCALVIGSPDYRAAAEDRLPAQERRGVRWEARMLKDAFYTNHAAARDRILPVVLPGRTTEDLPDWLSPGAATYYSVASFTVEGAEDLLRVLTTQPAYSPPSLGPRPELPPKTRAEQQRVFAVPALTGHEVPRPHLMADLVSKVTAPEGGTVGMTTALRGAGGFGKTTLARMLVRNPMVLEAFPDGIAWVTIGEDAGGPDLAAKVNDVIETVSRGKPLLSDPALAGAALGEALGNRRMLLVVDDIWSRTQLEPFLAGAPNTVRLVTTRQHQVLPDTSTHVDVDAMATAEAREVLLSGVEGAGEDVVVGLLKATGRWPVLLALVNGAARSDLARGADLDAVLGDILDALISDGPTVLDIANPDDRSRAVSATLGLSLSRLSATERARYQELAVFPEDVEVPLTVLGRYWARTGPLTMIHVRRLCSSLYDLSLLAEYHLDTPPRLRLHDVIRGYLRTQTSNRRADLDRSLVEAHRSLVAATSEGQSAWWQAPAEERYLWDWLPSHLKGGGLDDELEATIKHPGWLVGKLDHVGPAGLETDLSLISDPASVTLQRVIRQNAPVLAPLDPPGSLTGVLLARLPEDPTLATVREWLREALPRPCLQAVAALPDLPHPALRRTFTGHTSGGARAVAIAPNGSWLATAGNDGTVRIWDPATGIQRHTRSHSHSDSVQALAIAPDGSWLATGGGEYTVRIWDPATGTQRHTLTGHTGTVQTVAIAPDGSWLATGGGDYTVRIWDPVTGTQRHTLTGHTDTVAAVAIFPDGTWLATGGGHDGTVRIWDPVTGTQRRTLTGHIGGVSAVAIAPDGIWLATTGADGAVRIWHPATATKRYTVTGTAVTIAPDGTWMATASGDGTVRIRDAATSAPRHTLTGHTDNVQAIEIAPDGSWLATASEDGTVRIWDPAADTDPHALTGHTARAHRFDAAARDPVHAVAIAPDGTWLATGGWDGVRIWDLVTGTKRHTLTGHSDTVQAMAIAPDGTWLATGGGYLGTTIWDPVTGTQRHTLTGHTNGVNSVVAVAIAPDGSWLATASDDGTARIWDPVTGTQRHTLTGHTDTVAAVAIAPDSSALAPPPAPTARPESGIRSPAPNATPSPATPTP
jgi:WD40 repeat protein